MTIHSTVADVATRIRNGQQSRKLEILLKKTNKTINILNVLKTEGFIRGYKVEDRNILVLLKYISDKTHCVNIANNAGLCRRCSYKFTFDRDLYIVPSLAIKKK